MEKQFVIYPLALRLKALGFDEPCVKYVYVGDTGTNCNIDGEVLPSKAENFNADSLSISIPTYSQAFRWFREKYDLFTHIEKGENPKNYYPIINNVSHKYNPKLWFDTYEEAELECLNKLITILEDKP